MTRREFLVVAALSVVAAACAGDDTGTPATTTGPRPGSDDSLAETLPVPQISGEPFTLGIASGDPIPGAVVIWTRLAPDPLAGDGGMPAEPTPVRWEVASDEGFTEVVASGTALAEPRWGHSVHVDVTGLQPATSYWYRFAVDDHRSPVGRTRTAPDADTSPEEVRLAVATCQAYQSGFYAAYRDMTAHELDAVLFNGDYIYELESSTAARSHGLAPPTTTEEYRVLYAVNKTDADLQAAHAAFPWIVTWDDHEVEDNYGSLTPGGIGRSLDPEADARFPARRAAAYQAYWEHMPLRTGPPDVDGNLRIYRDLRFGDLVTAAVLDDRQYRDPIPDDAGAGALPRPLGGGPQIPQAFDESRSLLGAEQEQWLEEVLRRSDTTWKLLVQQTLMAEIDRRPDRDDAGFSADTWDGYVAARDRLLGFVHDEEITNLVSLGGDIHTAAVADLKPDYKEPSSPVVGTELIAPSISALELIGPEALEGSRSNPHIHEYEPFRRGWLLVSVTPERLTAEFRFVLDALVPDSGSESGGTWVVDAGDPQVHRS